MTAPNEATQTTQPGTAVGKVHPVYELFASDAAKRLIERFLPQGVDVERVAATVIMAMKQDKTKMLRKCTPESLVLGVARIQQWGLDLGVTAYLLPFKDKDKGIVEAVPVASYHGLAELMIASGAVRFVTARVVYAGDEFRYSYGTPGELFHKPCSKEERGPITHAYCVLDLPYGRQVFEVMLVEDIEEIRKKFSKQWSEGPLKPWYAKKTVVRQVSKLVPKNPRLARALAVMEHEQAVEIDPTPGAPKVQALGVGQFDELEILRQDRELAESEVGGDDGPPY